MNVIERALYRHPVTIGFVIGWVTCYAALRLAKDDSAGKDDGHPAGAERVAHREFATGVRLEGEGGESAEAGSVRESNVDHGRRALAGVGDNDKCLVGHGFALVAPVDRDGRMPLGLPAKVKAQFLKDEREGDAKKGEEAR